MDRFIGSRIHTHRFKDDAPDVQQFVFALGSERVELQTRQVVGQPLCDKMRRCPQTQTGPYHLVSDQPLAVEQAKRRYWPVSYTHLTLPTTPYV